MKLDSLWFSIGPLLVFNVILLCTVFIFRPIYKKRERLQEVEDRHASRLLNRWMREYWLWLTDPFVRLFIKLGLTPNILTGIGVLISFASGFFFWKGNLGLGGWFMILGATFDIFDGRVARETGQTTGSGAYFDSVMDRVSEGVVFLGLALYYRNDWPLWIVIIALLGSVMVSYTKARGEAVGIKYDGGSMQRPERIVYLGVGAIFVPVIGWLLSGFYGDLTYHLYLVPLSFVCIMCWVTSFDRISNTMRLIDEQASKS